MGGGIRFSRFSMSSLSQPFQIQPSYIPLQRSSFSLISFYTYPEIPKSIDGSRDDQFLK